jgi:hypothetical protein
MFKASLYCFCKSRGAQKFCHKLVLKVTSYDICRAVIELEHGQNGRKFVLGRTEGWIVVDHQSYNPYFQITLMGCCTV